MKDKPKQAEFTLDDEPVPKDHSMTRAFIDDTIEKMKRDEARKTSFQFKSGTTRFQEKQSKLIKGKRDQS